MAHKPRWLTFATAGIVAMMVFVACTPAAGPTASPRASTPAATPTGAAVTPGPGTPAPGTPEPGTPEPGTPEPGTPEPGTPAPIGTPYPEPLVQPGDPAAITDAYPNYGDPVDCAAKTWNGRAYTGSVKSITAPDAATVVFELCNPDGAFLDKVAFSVFGINDSEYLIEHAAAGDLKDFMNGTGPYKMAVDGWTRGAEIFYSRFDEYWGEPAAAATAVLKWADERLPLLQSGDVHGITLVGPTDFEVVRSDTDLQLLESGGLNTLYLGMNHDFEPWSNPLVRQALAIGIDRQRIVTNFMAAGSEVATHFTPCSIEFACLGDVWPATDVDAARQMIIDAGYPNGIDTTLAWRNPPARGYMLQPDETATDFKAQLESIGIRAELDHQVSGTFIANANAGALTGLFLLGWGADYPEVTNFLDYHFGTGCTSAFGACYPEIFDHLVAGATTSVEADRTAAYTAANNAIREQVPMVPISHAAFANAYLATVGGAQTSPVSNELLFRMVPPEGGDQIVFAQNGEPIGLYCADETDGESLRACEQSIEALYSVEMNGTAAIPALATSCDPTEEGAIWTCHLRQGVTFHNGATFEAKDVIVSFAAQWDALTAMHKGNTGAFEYWPGLWGGFLNPPGPCGLPNTAACPAP